MDCTEPSHLGLYSCKQFGMQNKHSFNLNFGFFM